MRINSAAYVGGLYGVGPVVFWDVQVSKFIWSPKELLEHYDWLTEVGYITCG